MPEHCLLLKPAARALRVVIVGVSSLLLFCLLVFAASGAESFRFAFLSDTHVGSLTGEEDLRLTVRDINSQTGLSFVVITGDITEYGSREQLSLAKGILAGLTVPYHIIPGNHDCKWSESGATDFPRLWQQDRFVFDCGGYRFIGMHEGPVMKMGDGFWAPQDVRWLAGVLKHLHSREQPLIFLTHYPIDDGIANWYAVLDLLKQHNTQVVLCGHGHANHDYSFEGVPGAMGRSNLRAGKPGAGYNLVEIKDDRMTFSERLSEQESKPPWHSVVLEKHNYAANTNRYPRPDFSVNASYPQVTERWSFDTGYTIASTPALWRELAIVGDASGWVRAIASKSGMVKWKFKTRNAVYSTPAVADDVVVVPSTDGNIYALKAGGGEEKWLFETGRPIVASPVIADGRVFIGSSEDQFRALDLKTGKLLWHFDGLLGFVETKPLVYENKVIFGAWDQHLYALDAATGKLLWRWQGDHVGTLLSPAACWPVAANGKVFVVAPDRKMTALEAATGTQLWRTGDYVVRESIGLSADQSRFYVRAMNDFFYAFSTQALQPEKIWDMNAYFGYDINSAMLVEKEETVFYGTKNGLLFALDASGGSIKWKHKVGVGVMNTVLPLSSNQVLVTGFDGKIVMVEIAAAAGK